MDCSIAKTAQPTANAGLSTQPTRLPTWTLGPLFTLTKFCPAQTIGISYYSHRRHCHRRTSNHGV
jgi:hypothetical protein